MTVKHLQAVYRNGSLRLARKLPLPDNTRGVLTWRRPEDAAEATRGVLHVPRRIAFELTTPHRFELWNA